jgi:hypothetical protein
MADFPSSQKLQLNGLAQVIGRNTLAGRFDPHSPRELDHEGKSRMTRFRVMNESHLNCPMNSGNRPGREIGIKRSALINQGDPVFGTNHPLNIRGCCGHALDFRMYPRLSQNLR